MSSKCPLAGTQMEQPNQSAQALSLAGIMARPKLLIGIAVLIASFSYWLYGLGRFAYQSSLYSYIILVPLVSLYFFRLRPPAGSREDKPDLRLAISLAAAG